MRARVRDLVFGAACGDHNHVSRGAADILHHLLPTPNARVSRVCEVPRESRASEGACWHGDESR